MQCSIPAFEGLLDGPHNTHLMKLLYCTAEWHLFAKLRMHTTSTLKHLEALTKEFGGLIRQFQDLTCLQFETVELPYEVRACKCQCQHSNTQPQGQVPAASSASSLEKVRKTLNLTMPKFYSLRDYVQTIWMFGCTDSYSTQLVW